MFFRPAVEAWAESRKSSILRLRSTNARSAGQPAPPSVRKENLAGKSADESWMNQYRFLDQTQVSVYKRFPSLRAA